jgi:hypothetical protein
MKHSIFCVTLMFFWTASLASAASPRAVSDTHGIIRSDGPVPYPGPIPPVQD